MKRTLTTDRGGLFFMLLIIYELRSFLYSVSPYITIGLNLVMLITNLYFIVIVNQRYRNNTFIKGLNIFLSLLVIYGLILIVSGNTLSIKEGNIGSVNTTAFFYRNIFSIGPIYAFYDIGRRRLLSEQRLKKWFYVLIVISIITFIHTSSMLISQGKSASELTNNAGYMFVALLPFIFFYKDKRVYQIALLGLFVMIIVASAKRGAIIVSAVALIAFILLSFRGKMNGSKLWLLFLILLFIVVGSYLLLNYYNTNAYFQYRIERTMVGDFGYREIIYDDLWKVFENSSIERQIFGYGAWATLDFTLNYAHQDWLEILIDMGLLGVFAYLYYWICFIYTCYQLRKKIYDLEYSILVLVFVITFLRSLFSMSFDNLGVIPGVLIGYALSLYDRKQILFSKK